MNGQTTPPATNGRTAIVANALALIKELGVPISVLMAMLMWFIAVDANWINSNSRVAIGLLTDQQRQVADLTKAVKDLTAAVERMADVQRAQQALLREQWCYAFVKDSGVLRQCLIGRDREAR